MLLCPCSESLPSTAGMPCQYNIMLVCSVLVGCAGVGSDLSAGIADIFFKLPVLKHNYAWAGSVSAGT